MCGLSSEAGELPDDEAGKHAHREGEHEDHTPSEHDDHAHEDDHGAHVNHSDHEEMFKRRFFVCFALALPVLYYSATLQGWFGYSAITFPGSEFIGPLFGTIVFLYGGIPFLRMGAVEARNRGPGMMLLISLAITVAFVYSVAAVTLDIGEPFFWELVTLVVIFLLGHWIEMRSVRRASGALDELAELMPDTAERITDDGDSEEVRVDDLKENDLVLVRPGANIPADGVVEEGESNVTEAMITGESRPIKKEPGDEVIGGRRTATAVFAFASLQPGTRRHFRESCDWSKRHNRVSPGPRFKYIIFNDGNIWSRYIRYDSLLNKIFRYALAFASSRTVGLYSSAYTVQTSMLYYKQTMKQVNETLSWMFRVIAISSSVVAVAAGTAVAREAGGYNGGMMNNGWGMFGGWGFLWLLLLVGLIVLIVSAVNGSDQSQGGEQLDRALAELRERYAHGEISEEEFEERRRTLRDTR